MGEKHFSQFGIKRFFAGSQIQRDIPEAEPLEFLRPGFFCLQTDKDRGGEDYGVSQRFGKAESVAGGTGGGIAQAAAGQNDRVSGKKGFVRQHRA